MLAMLSTLAPGHLDASSCTIPSRFRCRSLDRGIRCRRVPWRVVTFTPCLVG